MPYFPPPQQRAPQGLFGGLFNQSGGGVLGGGLSNLLDPQTLITIGGALMSGQTPGESFANLGTALPPFMKARKDDQLAQARQAALNSWIKAHASGPQAIAPDTASLLQSDPALAEKYVGEQLAPRSPPTPYTLAGRTQADVRNGYITAEQAAGQADGGYRPATEDELLRFNVPKGTPLVFGPEGKPEILGGVGAFGGGVTNNSVVDNVADGVINGTVPPDLKGFYKYKPGIVSKLAEQGFDLTKANQDYAATTRLLSTLNGPTQARMRQAIQTVEGATDIVENLADKWNAGGFPVLNAANRQLAMQGGLGPDAQQIATLLGSAIADITGEMGMVTMGGNSPTDHALDLAAQNLNADWSAPVLKAAIAQVREFVKYRKNSLNLSTAGTPDNQYDRSGDVQEDGEASPPDRDALKQKYGLE